MVCPALVEQSSVVLITPHTAAPDAIVFCEWAHAFLLRSQATPGTSFAFAYQPYKTRAGQFGGSGLCRQQLLPPTHVRVGPTAGHT